MNLETTRLSLRPLRLDDLDWLYEICIEPGVRKYLFDDEVISRSVLETIIKRSIDSFEAHHYGICSLCYKPTGAYIGFCGFNSLSHFEEIEIMYGLSSQFWGAGLIPEAAITQLQYMQNSLSIPRIIGLVNLENVNSQRVLEKVGMRFEKQVRLNNQPLLYYAIDNRM